MHLYNRNHNFLGNLCKHFPPGRYRFWFWFVKFFSHFEKQHDFVLRYRKSKSLYLKKRWWFQQDPIHPTWAWADPTHVNMNVKKSSLKAIVHLQLTSGMNGGVNCAKNPPTDQTDCWLLIALTKSRLCLHPYFVFNYNLRKWNVNQMVAISPK